MAAVGLYYPRMSRLSPKYVLTILAIALPIAAASARAAERMPAWLIRLPESTTTVFIAETNAGAFHRFDRRDDGVREIGRDTMSIGLGGTGKRRAGDQRTPLGIYFVTGQLDTSRLHEKYGVTAYPLDYPNAWDRRMGRSGDGIWVHGVDPRGGERPRRDTDGCIALPNESLSALDGAFEANVTPVLIAEEIRWATPEQVTTTRAEIERAVERWARSLEAGDMHAWLTLYDDSFRHWGMTHDEWVAFNLQTVGERPVTRVAVSDLLILGDPVENDLYLSRFRLEVEEEGGRNVLAMRRLYWRRAESGALTIVAEDAG